MSIFDKKKLKKIKKEEKEKAKIKQTIMIVDDEEAHLSSMKSLLEDDYHIVTARNGREALEIIGKIKQKREVSLIISDQRMPGLTGIELFEKIKDILPDTKRIILTGYIDIPVILDAINKTQIYQFIRKPFEPDDLKLRIKCAVDAFRQQKQLDRNYRTLEAKAKQLEEANKRLEEHNRIDLLTGLWNRRYVRGFIHSEIAKVQREYENRSTEQRKEITSGCNLSFMVLDIDNLKSINRLYKRDAGDIVLKQLTQILRKECRRSDTLVRWGGDEFLIVAHYSNRTAYVLAERLRRVVEKTLFDLGNGRKVNISCSIGFAAYPFLPGEPGILDWEKVMNIAKQCLCAVQHSGGNAWVGIESTEKTKTGELFRRIRDSMYDSIKSGELRLLTSIPDKNSIIWDK